MRESLKERLWAKLRSGRGASITFALLLFLVCAVIGSVVLAAGTAASGRISELAQADGRYYAVTSAAQLFREELDGQSYTVVRTKTTTTPYHTEYLDTNGEPTGDTSGTPIEVLNASEEAYSYSITDVSAGDDASVTVDATNSSLLSDASLELVLGVTAPATLDDIKDTWSQSFGDVSWTKELTVYLGDADNKKAPVGVTVKLESSESGASLSFTFKDQGEGSEHYSVSFTLTLQNGATSVFGMSEIKDETNSRYVKTETKTNRLVWTASGIRSGS